MGGAAAQGTDRWLVELAAGHGTDTGFRRAEQDRGGLDADVIDIDRATRTRVRDTTAGLVTEEQERPVAGDQGVVADRTARRDDRADHRGRLWVGGVHDGSRTFDFSALYNADGTPKIGPARAYGMNGIGIVEDSYMIPEGANTWSAKQYSEVPGYIFSDDLNLGFYVTRIEE